MTDKKTIFDLLDCDEKTLLNSFNSGKYQGTTYEEVYKNDPQYCRWIMNNSSKNFNHFVEWLKTQPPLPKYFTRGQHKNLSFEEVFYNTQKIEYIKWIMKTNNLSDELSEFKSYIEQEILNNKK